MAALLLIQQKPENDYLLSESGVLTPQGVAAKYPKIFYCMRAC